MKIIGIMWNREEGDILEETLLEARKNVDELLVVDDGSTDNSWDIMQKHKDKLAYLHRMTNNDKFQRQHLLDKAVEMFGRDIWIQINESDMMILDTNLRELVNKATGPAIFWFMINATRQDWTGYDTWPDWNGKSIKEIMNMGYVFERTLYTFRPLPGISYSNRWRPYPMGWEKYGIKHINRLEKTSSSLSKTLRGSNKVPLLAHFGYRGPKHFLYKRRGTNRAKEADRWFSDRPMIGGDKSELFPLSREGWSKYRLNCYRNKGRQVDGK